MPRTLSNTRLPLLISVCLVGAAATARGDEPHTWATIAAFDTGTRTSLVVTRDGLQIASGANGAVWAAEGSRSVAKISPGTGRELARYGTTWGGFIPGGLAGPSHDGNAPDLTAVDASSGDAYVANYGAGAQASVTKIYGDIGSCVDNNGHAGIQTSKDLNSDGIIDMDCNGNGIWDTVADVQATPCLNGHQQEYYGRDDECIAWNQDLFQTINDFGAGLAIDHAGDVWVQARTTGLLARLRASDGSLIETLDPAFDREVASGRGIALDPKGLPVGAQGVEAPTTGTWIGTWDTNASDHHLLGVQWTAALNGGAITVEGRASEQSPVPADVAWFKMNNGESYPAGSQASLHGRYVQVRVTLSRAAGANKPSPLLSHIAAHVATASAVPGSANSCRLPGQCLGGATTPSASVSAPPRMAVSASQPNGGAGTPKKPGVAFAQCNPLITCPNIPPVSCTGFGGASLQPPDPTITPQCGDVILGWSAVPDGNFLPLGNTTMLYTAQDNKGLTSTCQVVVQVVDNTPPSLICPLPVTVQCAGGGGATYTPKGPVVFENCCATSFSSSPSGPTVFPVGVTNVSYTGFDCVGNTATCTSTVKVVDAAVPTSMQTTTLNYWPSNGAYYTVSLTDANNVCGLLINDMCVGYQALATDHATITCVTSDEPNDANGNSIINLTATSVQLRQLTSGNNGRIYQINFTMLDPISGNSGTGVCTTTVSPNGNPQDTFAKPYQVCNPAQNCGAGLASCNGGNACEVNITNDPNNCGWCASTCPARANATIKCSNSVCGFTCSAGFADCDGNPGNGCEITTSTDVNNCGQCGKVCTNGQTCVQSVCMGALINCSMTKVYTNMTLVNQPSECSGTGIYPYNGCGGDYGVSWPDTGAGNVQSAQISFTQGLTCVGGVSRTTALNGVGGPTFAERGTVCACNPGLGPVTTVSMPANGYKVGQTNTFTATNPGSCEGFALANNIYATVTVVYGGGQVNPNTDPTNCGGCGIVCSSNNITPTCSAGVCNGTCAQGFANCDNTKKTNGCNINITNNNANCGGCGIACGNGKSCLAGACVVGVNCSSTKVYTNMTPVNFPNNCGNGSIYNDCSTDYGVTWTDTGMGTVSNVQIAFAQGVECTSNATRNTSLNGTAGPAFNLRGYFCDCTYNPPATTTLSLPVNAYVVGQANTFKALAPGTCAGFSNLNNILATATVTYGGLVNTDSDPKNCGGCAVVCSSNNITPTCAGGVCNGTCNQNYTNCDNTKKTNGCNVNTTNDSNNCGGCGVVCGGGKVCQNSVCTVCNYMAGSQTLNYTGGQQTFTVPGCVTSLTITAKGAQGANSVDRLNNTVGGLGGSATGKLAVSSGQVLNVFVGGVGSTAGPGGYNGGGVGGVGSAGSSCSGGPAGGGGGGTDVRVGGTAWGNIVIAAAGGGGAGRDYCNGSCQPCGCGGGNGGGGGATGTAGGAAYNCGYSYPGQGINGGAGGTANAGGAGGAGDGGGTPGSAGGQALGGTGSAGQYDVAGGGGGGGYYGGGGGGGASNGSGVGGGGGGGGSSYIGGVTAASTSSAVNAGNGSITFTW